MSLRIAIADDHPLYREGVARVLSEADDIDVVALAEDAASAVAMARDHAPDLVLLDISMPGGGLTALREIMALGQPPRVAMLTVSEEDDDILRALKGGAAGYVLKGIGGRDLQRIVRDLAEGRSYISPSLAAQMIKVMQGGTQKDSVFDKLTAREEDILRRVAEGLSNREIAEALSLQEKTVKHYMTAILQKLAVRNRTEAALAAREYWRD